MISPCSVFDLPTLFTPTNGGESLFQCLSRNRGEGEGGTGDPSPLRKEFFFGNLDPSRPEFIDDLGRGPYLINSDDPANGECFRNPQRFGSVVYQRMKDYYGPLYEIQTGKKHQGYGDPSIYNGFFDLGHMAINLPRLSTFFPPRNCTSGFFFYNGTTGEDDWHPGTCEADIICNTNRRSEAEACAEGRVCPEGTANLDSDSTRCPAGFACDAGTTPDDDLHAPLGQLEFLCPAGHSCAQGTGFLNRFQLQCAAGYFCPAGTADPIFGRMSSDGLLRRLSASDINPLVPVVHVNKYLPGNRLPVNISAHDQRCFDAIAPGIAESTVILEFTDPASGLTIPGPVNLADNTNLRCARDHKWRLVLEGEGRGVCACKPQYKMALEVYRAWECTGEASNVVTEAEETEGLTISTRRFRTCSFPADLSLGLASPWQKPTRWHPIQGEWFFDKPIRFPFAVDERRYYRIGCFSEPDRDCSTAGDQFDPWGGNVGRRCPQFCSFMDIKRWADVEYDTQATRKLSGEIERMDPLIYDLKNAVDLLDTYTDLSRADSSDDEELRLGTLLPTVMRLDNLTGNPLRYDACECEDLLRCPNGTTSSPRAESIDECQVDPQNRDVLTRVNPIPSDNQWLVEQNRYQELSDPVNPLSGVGTVRLNALETAVITLDLRGLSVNFTFGLYRLSLYAGCKPCPPRFRCNRNVVPPTCPTVPLDEQVAVGHLCSDCCRCNRLAMPTWLEQVDTSTNTLVANNAFGTEPGEPFFPFTDNKHRIWQVEIKSIRAIAITPVLELLHGRYYNEFRTELPGRASLTVTQPGRAIDYGSYNIEALIELFTSQWSIVSQTYTTPQVEPPVRELPDPNELQGRFNVTAQPGSIDELTGRRVVNPNLAVSGSAGLAADIDSTATPARRLNDPREMPPPRMSDTSARALAGRDNAVNSAGATVTIRAEPQPIKHSMKQQRSREEPLVQAGQLGRQRLESKARALQTVDAAGEVSFINFDIYDPSLYERQRNPWDHPIKTKPFTRGGFRKDDTFLGRTDMFNAPGDPRGLLKSPRFAFYALLDEAQFGVDDPSSLDLPMNLPRSYKLIDAVSESGTISGMSLTGVQAAAAAAAALGTSTVATGSYQLSFENDALLGVSIDYAAGDPEFAASLLADPEDGGPGELPIFSFYDTFLFTRPAAVPTAKQAEQLANLIRTAEASSDGAAAILATPPTDPVVLGFLIADLRASDGLGVTDALLGDIVAASRRVSSELGSLGTGPLCDVYMPDLWGGAGNSSTPSLTQEVRPSSDVAIDADEEFGANPLWFASADPLAENGRVRFLTLPYLPFISNCEFGDSNVWVSRITEQHGGCTVVDAAETLPVSAYPWDQMFDPVSDMCSRTQDQVCPIVVSETAATVEASEPGVFGNTAPDAPERHGVQMRCYYEEAIFEPGLRTRWYESGSGDTVFYMTKDPLPASEFIANPAEQIGWGRSDALQAMLGTDAVVGVTVSDDGPGDVSLVPRRVKLGMYYYQVNRVRKRIILAQLTYREMCTIADSQGELERLAEQDPPVYRCLDAGFTDFNYTLEVEWVPLNYLALLNLFAFSADIYVVYFAVLGIVVVMFGVVVWVLARIMTRLPLVPPLNLVDLGCVVSLPSCVGVAIATVPFAMVIAFTWIWFFVLRSEKPLEEPQVLNLALERKAWVDRNTITENDVLLHLRGRYGTVMQLIGWFGFIAGVRLLVPDEMVTDGIGDDINEDDVRFDAEVYEDKMLEGETVMTSAGGQAKHGAEKRVDPESMWMPHMWKRAVVVLLAFFVILLMQAVLEFSYSDSFSDNQYLAIVTFKLSNLVLEKLLTRVVREDLVVAPIMVLTSIVELLITLGASDFTDFVVAYLVELSLNIMERVLVDPLINTITSALPKWTIQCRRCCRRRRALRTKAQRAMEDDQWRAALEHLARETEGAEPVISAYLTYANGLTAMLMSPFVQIYYLLTDTTGDRVTQVPELYGIRAQDLVFYTIFAVLIVFFTIAMDLFLMNALELLHGWRLYDMLQYFSYRFSVREKRWQLFSRDFDPTVSGSLQSTDLLSFSSQFYFITAGIAYALFLILAGMNIHLRTNWSLVSDPWFIFLLVISWLFVRVCSWLCIRAAEWAQLWALPGVRRLRNNVAFDKELARRQAEAMRKAIEDAENKRIEAKALRDDEFRHRWLKRNKPWVIAKIADILTPRQLAREGPDNLPMEEWVRGIYDRLTGEGPDGDWTRPDRNKRDLGTGRRSDISDFDSDEDPALNFLKQPMAPLPGRSADMIRTWLAKARRRILYSGTVADVIRAEKDKFARTVPPDRAAVFTVELARPTDGVADGQALNHYIAEYETLHPPENEPPSAPFNEQRWRAFFRSRAKYTVTERNRADAADRARKQAEKDDRRKAMGRLTRPGDLSDSESDSDLSDASTVVEFDPVVVDPEAPVGRLMAKWLDAARKRVGGVFPRPQAEEQVASYVTKMRERQRRKALGLPTREEEKQAAKEAAEEPTTGRGLARAVANAEGRASTAVLVASQAAVPAVAAGLAQRWLAIARDRRIAATREDLDSRLERMTAVLGPHLNEQTDWYFGSDMRTRGEDLMRLGEELRGRRRVDEEEARLRGVRIVAEADEHGTRMRATMDTERQTLQQELRDKEERLTRDAREKAEALDIQLRSRALKLRADASLPSITVPTWSADHEEPADGIAGESGDAAAAIAEDLDAGLATMPEAALLSGLDDAAREELIGLLRQTLTVRDMHKAVLTGIRDEGKGRLNELINKQGRRHGALATRRAKVEREAQALLSSASEAARTREMDWVREATAWLSSAEARVARRAREEDGEVRREIGDDKSRFRPGRQG